MTSAGKKISAKAPTCTVGAFSLSINILINKNP